MCASADRQYNGASPCSRLKDVRVINFITLLPSPLAMLLLVEAEAKVIKIERPGLGDEMRLRGLSLMLGLLVLGG